MGAQENTRLVQDYMQAVRDRDEEKMSGFLAEDAVIRVAGVPRALGGVTQGRDQILQNFREGGPQGESELQNIFADDDNVCTVQKVHNLMSGTQHFRGNDNPYATYQSAVFKVAGGRIQEQTLYINFLDVYVQSGLVQLNSLRA